MFPERGKILLQEHRGQQGLEQDKWEKHRKKCEKNPTASLAIIIDGMDQSKTDIPHFVRKPKDANENLFLRIHLVGCLIYSAHMTFRIFLNYPNVRNDANLTITILQTILREFPGPLPPTLYLQLDNTARENKNNLLMAYLGYLVHTRVFRKIKLGFLLVGHTHDRIDQMFSRLSVKLNKNDALSKPRLEQILLSAQNIVPQISTMDSVFDFRSFAFSKPAITLDKLQNLSFSHQFKIERKNDEDCSPFLWAKKVSTDTQWLPEGGVQFLVDEIPNKQIFFAKGVPLSKTGVAEVKSQDLTIQQMDVWLKEFEDQIATLRPRYIVDSVDKEWWSSFFSE